MPSAPHDSDIHGTHVSGTAVGGDASGTRIGVAPGADLMGGLVLPAGTGTFAQVLAGMQWSMAPFDIEGNPAGAPADVVNMSLGAEGHYSEFIEPVRNMYLAGIFPAFAIGNNCAAQSSSSPGNIYEAASVGATDSEDNVAPFSCGEVVERSEFPDAPADWPDSYVVPDVSAPGVAVSSALPGGGYGELDGTSMATPHVAGTAALLIEADPDISVDEAVETLAGTSVFDDRHGSERPNARFGWGRIDALAAVTEARLTSGVAGTVTDAGSQEPIAGAVVTRLDNGRMTRTDDAGRFELRLPPGTHSLEVSRFGYEVRTITGITVQDGQVTEVSADLTALPKGDITGRVSYGPTGSAVPGATVELVGAPIELSTTATRSGAFTLRGVPEGSYQVAASAPGLPRSAALDVEVSAEHPPWADLVLPAPSRVSLGADGAEGDEYSGDAAISADGRYVAFTSPASNLVPGDTNGADCGTLRPCGHDVFVHDRQTGEIARVSLSSDGDQGDLGSGGPSMSHDGRYVAFTSSASNLVPGDTNEQSDVFVHDRQTGRTVRASVASDGTQADGGSLAAALSGDGRYLTFNSIATNLVDGDTNMQDDVFVRDLVSGRTTRVSVSSDGVESDGGSFDAAISDDGQHIAFDSTGTTLVPGDTNGQADVFVHDVRAGTTDRVSVATDGTQPTRRASTAAAISGDGRYVAYQSGAAELVPGDTNARSDIFLHDRESGTTERVSLAVGGAQANDNSFASSFSSDGRYVVFTSGATNIVSGDTNGWDDVFVLDRETGTTERGSVAPDGTEANHLSGNGVISDDGRYVAFESIATNLEAGDTNEQVDAFVHDTRPAEPATRFAVSGLTVRPETSRAGRSVDVSAVVKNLGDLRGRYDAVLRVDGVVSDTATFQVEAGKVEMARFVLRGLGLGTHVVTFGPLSAELTVVPR